jgi:hypothetical protein
MVLLPATSSKAPASSILDAGHVQFFFSVAAAADVTENLFLMESQGSTAIAPRLEIFQYAGARIMKMASTFKH